MKKLVKCSVFVVLAFLLSNCGLRDKEVSGYIPEDQKPFYTWVETRPGSKNWDCCPKIMVILEKGDTIFASFSEGTFAGSYAIRYRDSYPPAVGSKIYVRMNPDNGSYLIFDATPKKVDKGGPVGAPAWPN